MHQPAYYEWVFCDGPLMFAAGFLICACLGYLAGYRRKD